jgi:hypothetical protein
MHWPLSSYELKIIAGLGALAAFSVGLWQYNKAQKWQKSQILLDLMDAFRGDQLIQAACLMLDWDQRDILLPDGRQIVFANGKLPRALRVQYMDDSSGTPSDKAQIIGLTSQGNGEFSPEETSIRDCFDRFFDFFDKLHAFRRNKLLDIKDLRYFFYWLELVRVIGQYKNDKSIQATMDNYIATYNFRGFRELSAEYSRKPEPIIATSKSDNQ